MSLTSNALLSIIGDLAFNLRAACYQVLTWANVEKDRVEKITDLGQCSKDPQLYLKDFNTNECYRAMGTYIDLKGKYIQTVNLYFSLKLQEDKGKADAEDDLII